MENVKPEVVVNKRKSPEPERKSPEVIQKIERLEPDIKKEPETPQKRTASIMSKIRENIAKKSQSVKEMIFFLKSSLCRFFFAHARIYFYPPVRVVMNHRISELLKKNEMTKKQKNRRKCQKIYRI